MAYLTDVYAAISAQDQQLEKEAAEIMKVAEEHDAAGRIMARGFADELNKIAELNFENMIPGGRKIAPATPAKPIAKAAPKPMPTLAGRVAAVPPQVAAPATVNYSGGRIAAGGAAPRMQEGNPQINKPTRVAKR